MQNCKSKFKIIEKSKILLPTIKTNVLLKNYTTFKIGGRAKYFFEAKTKDEIISVINLAKEKKLSFFVLGGGSNILISDKGYDGLVIKVKSQKLKVKSTGQKSKIIEIESGILLSSLVSEVTKNNLTGLEWAVGIPGTIGGAIKGNSGAFGKSIKDIVKEVEVFDVKDEKIKLFKNRDCKFEYRNSIFKQNPNLIILSTIIKLKKETKEEIQKKIKEYLSYRKKTQPLNFSSAGSIFKNPQGFSAGELIEKCGLKGKKIGGVQISEKHCNFIVNLGGGKAKDVTSLIKLIKQKVKNKFGIILEEEIQLL